MVLGIDIGLAGAVALIAESGELIEIHDMPTLEDGPRNRATINAPLLAAIVAKSCAAHWRAGSLAACATVTFFQ